MAPENKRFYLALHRGRSGLTISWRAESSASGSPFPRMPLALAFHGPGRGRDGLCRFPEGCCWAALDRRWRQQEGTLGDERAAAGGGVVTAAGRRGRLCCLIISVRFCAVENWARLSTVWPKRPALEIGESKKRCLSDSLISAWFNHRWRSWTTSVDIVWPRDRAVTFDTLKGKVHHRAQLLHQTWVRTALVQLLQQPWPGRLAGEPWCAGQRRPVQLLCKPRRWKRMRTQQPWTGDVDYHYRHQAAAFHGQSCNRNSVLDWGGSPHTP